MFHASPLHPSSPNDYSRVPRLSQTSFLSLSTVYIYIDLNIRPYRNASFLETAKKSKKEIIPADVVNACTILYHWYPIEELSGPKDFASRNHVRLWLSYTSDALKPVATATSLLASVPVAVELYLIVVASIQQDDIKNNIAAPAHVSCKLYRTLFRCILQFSASKWVIPVRLKK